MCLIIIPVIILKSIIIIATSNIYFYYYYIIIIVLSIVVNILIVNIMHILCTNIIMEILVILLCSITFHYNFHVTYQNRNQFSFFFFPFYAFDAKIILTTIKFMDASASASQSIHSFHISSSLLLSGLENPHLLIHLKVKNSKEENKPPCT